MIPDIHIADYVDRQLKPLKKEIDDLKKQILRLKEQVSELNIARAWDRNK